MRHSFTMRLPAERRLFAFFRHNLLTRSANLLLWPFRALGAAVRCGAVLSARVIGIGIVYMYNR